MTPYHNNPENITYFAETDARGKRTRFGIKAKDRTKHMYVIGKTGMGKSTLLENIVIQDIQNGEGIAFIDPHGASAEKLLDYIPEERIKDVIYFAPFDIDNPVSFNIMEDIGYDKRHLVVSGLMSAFKKIWVDAWSGRMEYILTNTLLALLEYPGSTLLDVNRMYTNKVFRKRVVENIKDPIVRSFWVDEFATYTDRYTQEATPAIQNKVGQFTSNPVIRNIIGQQKSTFDLRDIMDNRKIFIVNLSKGRIGETNADLLGSMLTTKIYLAAMSRADLPAQQLEKLPPFYFFVDEFQSIANESFTNILSEARKYKLNLTIAHQYVAQMEETVRDAVFGNVGTTIMFRIGPFDAEALETVFKPKFAQEDLINLSFAQIYLTLMIDGVGSPPFSATTLPPIPPPQLSYRDQVISSSQKTYGRRRDEVEKEITDYANELSEAAGGGSNKGMSRDQGKSQVRDQSREFSKKPETKDEQRKNSQQRNSGPNKGIHSFQGDLKQPYSKKDNVGGRNERKEVRAHDSLGALVAKTQPKNGLNNSNRNQNREASSGSKRENEEHLKDLRNALSRIANDTSTVKSKGDSEKKNQNILSGGPKPVSPPSQRGGGKGGEKCEAQSSKVDEVPEETLRGIIDGKK